MYLTIWLVLVALGTLTTVVAFWGPDPPTTVYAALANLGLWALVSFGVTRLEVLAPGTGTPVYFASGAVSLLAGGHAVLSSLVPLFVGLYEWYTDEETGSETDTRTDMQQLEERLDA